MKRGVSILAATAAAIASLTALAMADRAAIPANVFLSTQGGGQILARDFLLGNQVYNADGKIVGDIEDLILNSNNQIEGVVMGTGGFAGFGEKHVGVVLSALQIKNDDGKVTVTLPQATKEVLEALEPFKRSTPQKSLLDRAIAKAQELSDKGSVTAKDAYEKAKPALDEAKKQAKETYEEIKKEAGPALEKAKEQAKEAYDSARKAVENMPDSGPAAQGTPPVPPEGKPATTPETAPASPEPAPAPKP